MTRNRHFLVRFELVFKLNAINKIVKYIPYCKKFVNIYGIWAWLVVVLTKGNKNRYDLSHIRNRRSEMNEIAKVNGDIEHFLSLKQSELDMVVAGMANLMSDSEGKYESMKNQNWFKRMIFTVTGKNRATLADIQRNNEQLNAYCAKALSIFVERQRISEGMVLNIGMQINALYATHLELKELLHGIAVKLNEKIESIDNYHMLFQEIDSLKKFGNHYTDIYRVLALLDKRMLADSRKMGNLSELLHKRGILGGRPINVMEYLLDVCKLPGEYAGSVYMEVSGHHDNMAAQLTASILESWNFLPGSNRQLLKQESVAKKVIDLFDIDSGAELSLSAVYDELVENKRIMLNQSVIIFAGNEQEQNDDDYDDDDEESWASLQETIEDTLNTLKEISELMPDDGIVISINDSDSSYDVITSNIRHYFSNCSNSEYYVGPYFDNTVLSNAKRHTVFKGHSACRGDIAAIVSSISLFKANRGDDGYVFTTEGIYSQESLSDSRYIPYANILRANKVSKILGDELSITLKNGSVISDLSGGVNRIPKDKLANAINDIVNEL